MQSLLIFSASTPILILSTFDDPGDPGLAEKLGNMGFSRFIAFEVPREKTEQIYGVRFDQIRDAIHDQDDIRVLDYNGSTTFQNFSVDDLTLQLKHEPTED